MPRRCAGIAAAPSARRRPSIVTRAGVGRLEPGDEAQERGLARAGGTDDRRAAAGEHRKVDLGKRLDGAIALRDAVEAEKAHRPALRRVWACSSQVSGREKSTISSA